MLTSGKLLIVGSSWLFLKILPYGQNDIALSLFFVATRAGWAAGGAASHRTGVQLNARTMRSNAKQCKATKSQGHVKVGVRRTFQP